MIGLPDCIRTTGTMAMYQFKLVAEPSRTFMSQRDQPRIKPGDDGVDGAVRRRSPLPLFAKCENTPVDGCCRGSWLFEEQPFINSTASTGSLRRPRSSRVRRTSPVKPSARYWASHRSTVRKPTPAACAALGSGTPRSTWERSTRKRVIACSRWASVSSAKAGDLSSKRIATPLDYTRNRVRKTILQRTVCKPSLDH